MSKNKTIFDQIIGSKIYSVKSGYGTFFTIDSRGSGGENYHLWIYMTDWSLTKDGNEVLSSDLSDNITTEYLSKIFTNEIEYIELDSVDEMEFHIVFSDNIVLEIWIDPADGRYDFRSEMVKMYKNEKFIGSVMSGDVVKSIGFT